jgi:hypothetical protein
VCFEMEKSFIVESKTCLLSSGWDVSADGGGEEKKFFWRAHIEYSVL